MYEGNFHTKDKGSTISEGERKGSSKVFLRRFPLSQISMESFINLTMLSVVSS